MAATPLTDLAQRLLANVDQEHGDYRETMLNVPVVRYRDEERFQEELEYVFRRSPVMVALSCDIPAAGDYTTLDIAQRPIVVIRGEDGVGPHLLQRLPPSRRTGGRRLLRPRPPPHLPVPLLGLRRARARWSVTPIGRRSRGSMSPGWSSCQRPNAWARSSPCSPPA